MQQTENGVERNVSAWSPLDLSDSKNDEPGLVRLVANTKSEVAVCSYISLDRVKLQIIHYPTEILQKWSRQCISNKKKKLNIQSLDNESISKYN